MFRSLLACLMAASMLPFVAFAQTTVKSDEGDQGAEFGKDLLRSAPKVTHNAAGGERGAGALTIQGVGTIGVNELAPGADRSKVDSLSQKAGGLNATNAQDSGAQTLRSGLRDQGAGGDALRTMVTSESMPESQLAGDEANFWGNTARSVQAGQTGTLSGVFADCKDEVSLRRGDSIIIERSHEFTCEENVDVAPRCGRERQVVFAEIERQEETVVVLDQTIRVSNRGSFVALPVGGALSARLRYRGHAFSIEIEGDLPEGVSATVEEPSSSNGWNGAIAFSAAPNIPCPTVIEKSGGAPLCPPPEESTDVRVSLAAVLQAGDWYKEEILEGPGNCLARYEAEFGCPLRFACSSEMATLDRSSVTADLASRIGMAPLYSPSERMEGAREVAACAVAEAVPLCTVCADEENNTGCVVADVRQGGGVTCGQLQSDRTCSERGARTCILYAEKLPGQENDPPRCVTYNRSFTCTKRESSEPEIISTVTNSCAMPELACAGDGCRREQDLKGDAPGTSLQTAIAGLAVGQAMTTDITQGKGSGSGAGSAPPASTAEVTEGYALGYDQDDDGGAQGSSEGWQTEDGGAIPFIDTSNIQVFRGESGSCKKALGGLIRCCQPTKSDANKRYWSLFSNINRGSLAGSLLSREGPSTGSWAAMAGGGGSLNMISQSLASGKENVTGGGTGGATGGDGSIGEVHDQFMAQARQQIRPSLSPKWACASREFDLAVRREIGSCSFAGTYCRRRVFGVCLEKRESYCCYSSPMSKMLRAHADGGTIRHGNARSPDCSGLSLERLASIDWETLDLSQLVGHMQEGGAFPAGGDIGSGSVERYTGSGATAGGAGRVNVTDRTADRLGQIDAGSVSRGVQAEAEGLRIVTAPPPEGPALLSFSTTYHVGRADEVVIVRIVRSGSVGSASFAVDVQSGASEIEGIEGAAQSWGAGDLTDRFVRVRLSPNATQGTEIRLRLSTSNELGAVTAAIIEVI